MSFNVEGKVEELTFSNQKDKLSSFINEVNGVDKLFESFALTHQGSVIFLSSGFGCIETSPSGLKDLHQLVQTAKGLIAQDIAVGIGQDLKTSSIACSYCLNQKDSQKPVIFQPGMERCLDGEEVVLKAEQPAPEQNPAKSVSDENDPENQMMQLIAQSLDKVKNSKDFIERIREVDPNAYEAIKSIVSAMILMARL